MTEKTVVQSERQVEHFARDGIVTETRAALTRRLALGLAPEIVLASPVVTRIALDLALEPIAADDALLAPIARAGGAAWMRTVDAVDRAIGALRAAATMQDALAAASRASGTVGARARTLGLAMRALDAELARAGLVDGRAAAVIVARALGKATPDDVVRAVGARRLVARGIVAWDAADVALWRALDIALARRGGGARIELPAFDAKLDVMRDRDPLEVLADDLARALDEAPLLARIPAPIGDLRCEGEPPERARTQIEIRRAADAHAQARAVVDAVHDALARGIPVDRIAVALPVIDEETLGPIRRAFDDAEIVAHDPRGPAPIGSGLVACAMDALALAARGLPRGDVAVLLRSRYLDAPAMTGIADRREATRRLLDLARALEETPTARAEDPLAAMIATVRAFRTRSDRPEEPARVEARVALAVHIGEVLGRVAPARTYLEHVHAARALFAGLGLAPRLGAGARTVLARDGRADGIARAELQATARDAHAWQVLESTLEAWEAAAVRLGAENRETSGEAFRHQLVRVLEVGASPLGAARAAAVRIGRLSDLSGEELSLLIIVDANDGVLPPGPVADPLVPDALASALRETSPGAGPTSHAIRHARELASLAQAAARAERICFTCRARDERGGLVAPAPIVAWLERGGVPSRAVRTSATSGAPLSLADARLLWLHAAPDDAAQIAPEAARRAAIERRRESFFYDPSRRTDAIVGAVDIDPELERALTRETGEMRPLAVTSLERIARCPFMGFASVVLGARDRERRGELPDAREEGTLLHDALAAAFRVTADLWSVRPRDGAAIEQRALATVDEVLARELVGSPLRDVVLARARDDVRAVLAWSLADDAWDFARAEQPFGDESEGAWPPLQLETEAGALFLRGKIDRVDVGHLERRARVIDYKRSKRTALEGAKTLGDTAFQVPIYALAASRAMGRPGREGLYVPTGARDLRPDYRVKDAFAAALTEVLTEDEGVTRVERNAARLVAEMRKGALAPIPRDKRACAHCDVRGACRQPRFAVTPDEDGDG